MRTTGKRQRALMIRVRFALDRVARHVEISRKGKITVSLQFQSQVEW